MIRAYLLLLGAIGFEVVATLALRGSHGLSRLVPSVAVVVGYVVSFVLLAWVLRVLNVGMVYAIWSGLGTVGVFLGSFLIFDERPRPVTIVGAVIIVLGVVVMNLGGTSEQV